MPGRFLLVFAAHDENGHGDAVARAGLQTEPDGVAIYPGPYWIREIESPREDHSIVDTAQNLRDIERAYTTPREETHIRWTLVPAQSPAIPYFSTVE